MIKNVPVRVKDALREGNLLKRYRFNVLKANGTTDFTINNDYLVYESVKFDERMCSGDELKFGLCEGSSLEFQYFDKANITGRTLKCFIDVQYKTSGGSLAWYNNLPMGFFTVDKCSRQASTGIQKVTAYNKLQSKYLDAKANELLIEAYNDQDSYSPSTIEKILDMALADYKIDAHTIMDPTAYHDITNKSSLSTGKTIDLQVYKMNGQVAESHYLHAICPWVRIKFSHLSHMYKIADFNVGTILEKVYTAAGIPDGTYDDYYVQSNNDQFYTWLTNKGSDVSDIRAGVFIYNYTDGANTAHDVTGYVLDFDKFPTPYYWSINQKTTSYAEAYDFGFYCPVYWVMDDNPTYTWSSVSTAVLDVIRQRMNDLRAAFTDSTNLEVWKQKTSIASDLSVGSEIENWPDVTLRQLQSAVFELECQYGKLDRVTDQFSGVELNNARLLPADTLYPADTLFPGGLGESGFRSWYSKLWTDLQGEQSFRNLIITYKALDENNVPTNFEMTKQVNADGTTDYYMSDNWLLKNLIWDPQDVEDYADDMVTKMENIHWFPFEMWAAGLPYVETGDMIEIIVGAHTYTSYILQRQLSGIQNLQDTYINGTLDIF